MQFVHVQKLPAWPATHCPSCDAESTGAFCASCGEALRHHLPSAREFFQEFIGHYIALEGKLVQTLKLLVFQPGRLTVDLMRGRRVPYIAPLRLYLTLSLILFALFKWSGVALPMLTLENQAVGVSYSHRAPGRITPDGRSRVVVYVKAEETDEAGKTPVFSWFAEHFRSTVATVGRASPASVVKIQAFMAQTEKQQSATLNHGFLVNVPYMLIGALPLFALYLKVLYLHTGRTYGEHLVFALHANAFAFLMVSIMIAIPGNVAWIPIAAYGHLTRFISAWDYLQLLPFLWLLAYLPVAMQRVYGGSRVATAVKWSVLLAVHLFVISGLTIVAELIDVVGHG